jgi:hypothetical protein
MPSVRATGKVKAVLHKLDRHSTFVEFPDDPAKVVDVAREPIKAVDDQRVTFAEVFQRGSQLRALSIPAARLIGEDLF